MTLSADTELARQGGRFNAALGMLLTTLDVTRMGDMHIQSLMHWLMLAHYDDREGVPMSGFPRSLMSGANCQASKTADLDFDVAVGWGLVYDQSQIGGDEFAADAYQMVVNGAGFSGSLAAHDPTNPRIDLVALKPIQTEDQSATRNIKDPTTGVESTTGVNQRSRFSSELVIVAGTPAASPSAPVLPSGHLLVAYADVPATSGAAVLRDARQILHIGNWIKGPPSASYSVDHVHPPGTAGELLTMETTPASLAVQVDGGRATLDGTIRFYPEEILALATADPTNPRIDLVSVLRDGTKVVTTGTPAGSPAIPAGPADSIGISYVNVAALATTIVNANIVDTRNRAWLNGSLALRDGTVPVAKLSELPWRVEFVSASTPTSDVKRLEYKIVDVDGNDISDLPASTRVLVELIVLDGTQSIESAANYDNTNASNNHYNGGLLGMPTDTKMWPYVGLDNKSAVDQGGGATDGNSTGRWYGNLTATTFSVEWCRHTVNLPAAKAHLVVSAVGSDGFPVGPSSVQTVEFS